MKIRLDDLRGPEIAALLREHLRALALLSPPESMHALDLDALRKPDITFWSVWEGPELLGCGALKELDRRHGEIKSPAHNLYFALRLPALRVFRRLFRRPEQHLHDEGALTWPGR